MKLKNITRMSQSVYKGKPAPGCLAAEHFPSTAKARLWGSEFSREGQMQRGCDSRLCGHPQWRNLLTSSAHRHELMRSSPGSSFLRHRGPLPTLCSWKEDPEASAQPAHWSRPAQEIRWAGCWMGRMQGLFPRVPWKKLEWGRSRKPQVT